MDNFITMFFTQLGNGFSYVANFEFYNGIKLIHIAIFIVIVIVFIGIITHKK
jgi:uncharacterized membrane protein